MSAAPAQRRRRAAEPVDAVERAAYEKLPSFMKRPNFETVRKENQISFRSFVRLVALERIKALEAPKPEPKPQQPELAEIVE